MIKAGFSSYPAPTVLRLPRRRRPRRPDQLPLRLRLGQRRRSAAITVRGRPRRQPLACVDPVVVAARIVLDLQIMQAARSTSTDTPSSPSARSTAAPNIIPDEVKLEPTMRTYGEGPAGPSGKIGRIVKGTGAAAGAEDLASPSARPRSTTTPPSSRNFGHGRSRPGRARRWSSNCPRWAARISPISRK